MQHQELTQFSQKINSYSKTIQELKNYIEQTKGKVSLLSEQINSIEKENEENKTILEISNKSIKILNNVSFEVREKYIKKIEDLVTLALKEVFSEKDIRLSLSLSTDTVKNNLKICIIENDREFNIMKSRGLGLADLISIAIQICIKNMVKPRRTFPIILDERLKFLHSQNSQNDYIYRAYLFLRKVCEKLDEQIIIVTGEEDFIDNSSFSKLVNKTFHVKQVKSISEIKEI